mmetsp:Transcript_71711/g.181165  ORF Transcript_71711/g.181165 Transcript_71711/m.181165 type:complete len:223 (-) Transcript_71711:706-1374(-)
MGYHELHRGSEPHDIERAGRRRKLAHLVPRSLQSDVLLGGRRFRLRRDCRELAVRVGGRHGLEFLPSVRNDRQDGHGSRGSPGLRLRPGSFFRAAGCQWHRRSNAGHASHGAEVVDHGCDRCVPGFRRISAHGPHRQERHHDGESGRSDPADTLARPHFDAAGSCPLRPQSQGCDDPGHRLHCPRVSRLGPPERSPASRRPRGRRDALRARHVQPGLQLRDG